MALISNTRSHADTASARLDKIIAAKRVVAPDHDTLSESDTRAKVIDPIFKEVLGWNEAEIRREKSVQSGFVDYVIGAEFGHYLVEAKRVKPRFQLTASNKPRRLQLNGPHLLGNKKVKPFIEQAQAYASDLGVQFCIVTNGSQFIVFKPYVPGKSWRQSTAIVFHDYRDIREHFAEFYALLAREHVLAGSVVEAFAELDRTTMQLYSPIDYLADKDKELVRNRVWQQIARTMGPLLTDKSDDLAGQLEVIENCYVTTPLADQADKNLDSLLKDVPKRDLVDARVVNLKPGQGGKTAFSHTMEREVKSAGEVGTYVLTGGVGSGKTTFLRRFAYITDRTFVEQFTVWVHIDFLPIGNIDPSTLDEKLRSFAYRRIREEIQSRFRKEIAGSGDQLRALFSEELQRAELTTLHGLEAASPERNRLVNQLVDSLYQDDERFVFAALRMLRKRRRIALVLDNTDQLGELFQEKVFLFAKKIADDFKALCVVTLREEKFFAAYRRGIFDAFGDHRFHMGSPDLKRVLRKRLEYGRAKFAALEDQSGPSALSTGDLQRIDALLNALIHATTGNNPNIVRMLASVSNGDMRHALDMFREFLSSGNTDVEKIIQIVSRSGAYSVPFHEFAKSAILGSRKYYRSDVSHFVNVFKQSGALAASHLTAVRVLARLSAGEGVASAHGEGFVSAADLLKEFRDSFGFADDLVQWTGELLGRNLVESEPPRVHDVRHSDALRITPAGLYYWRYLVRSFAYVDLVLVDTPIASLETARKLADFAEMTDMVVRFERVRLFLDYLKEREAEELVSVIARGGPFVEPLIPQLAEQIEQEISVISGKTGVRDEFGPPDHSTKDDRDKRKTNRRARRAQ